MHTPETIALIRLWHRRLGHPSKQRLVDTIKASTGIDLDPKDVEFLACTTCDEGTCPRYQSHDTPHRESLAGAGISIDLITITPVSFRKHKYAWLLTDDAFRYRFVGLGSKKNEVLADLKGKITAIETLSGRKTLWIKLDGGREFFPTEIEKWCTERGTGYKPTAPYNSYQNGVSERGIRFLIEVATKFAIFTKIPRVFWCYLLEHTVFVLNITATKTLKGMTPYQGFWQSIHPERSFVPDLSSIHVLGCGVTIHVPHEHRTRSAKFSACGTPGIFLGIADAQKLPPDVHNFNVYT